MKERALAGAAEGLWLRAEKQTGGKGRLARKWESPEGNLYCSGLVKVRSGDPPPASLSFVAALAVHEAIREYLPNAEIQLKWPNDILLSDSKTCGILLERAGDFVVVGIGVNIGITPIVEGRKVTSLQEAGADPVPDPGDFLERLSQCFEGLLSDWRHSGLKNILTLWQAHAHQPGTRLTTSDVGGKAIEGEYAGLSDDGALRLRKADGTLIEIRAGDIEVG